MAQSMTLRAAAKMVRKTDRRWERRLREAEKGWQQTLQILQQVVEEQRQEILRLQAAVPEQPLEKPLEETPPPPPARPAWDGSWGGLIDALIIPASDTLFAGHGLSAPFQATLTRLAPKLPGHRYMRIDLLLVADEVALPMLVSSRLTLEEVRGHIRQLPEFRDFFPQYAHCRLYGAVAGITLEEGVEPFAVAQGLFVVRPAGEGVQLANGPDFVPKVW
ncbi:MAG: hypothetical protein HQL88_06750 [Magnetococcales bacterium]|nr:hypothetical protein [Magnetococcales bacterium]